jgi:hypothetical protein
MPGGEKPWQAGSPHSSNFLSLLAHFGTAETVENLAALSAMRVI